MKCSIVILNWNGEKMLRQFLPSVVSNVPKDCEVVVADNGSSDTSLEVLKQFPEVRTIILDKNYGFAEGYNRALEQVDAEYTVLLNSDIEVTEGWLLPILKYMDAHPEVGAAQPKILKYSLPVTGAPNSMLGASKPYIFEHAGAAGGYIDTLGYPFCRGRIMGYVEEDHGQYNQTASIFWATGCALCIRTALYKEVGGLDADFFAHMEEIDLCWRLNCRGYQLVCIPESSVFHVGGGALAYENPRKTFLNFRNNMLLLYKNLPNNKLCWIMPVRCILDYVAALQYFVSGKISNAKAVCEARMAYHRMRKHFAGKRKENMRLAKVLYPATIAQRSIILDYYVRGKRK